MLEPIQNQIDDIEASKDLNIENENEVPTKPEVSTLLAILPVPPQDRLPRARIFFMGLSMLLRTSWVYVI